LPQSEHRSFLPQGEHRSFLPQGEHRSSCHKVSTETFYHKVGTEAFCHKLGTKVLAAKRALKFLTQGKHRCCCHHVLYLHKLLSQGGKKAFGTGSVLPQESQKLWPLEKDLKLTPQGNRDTEDFATRGELKFLTQEEHCMTFEPQGDH
jgi:hypothetical protein